MVRPAIFTRSLAAFLAFAALVPLARAQAPAPDLAEIRRQVEAGRSDEAWEACAPLLRDAVADADLWCGIAAVDRGYAAQGVLALERYVLRDPGDVRARLELARAYFYAGDDVSARRGFEDVRAMDPPADVRAGIDRYLEALTAREWQYRTRVTGFVEAGVGYDSNVNAGVAQADLTLPVLGPVTVATFGVEQSSPFGWLAGAVQVNHPVAPGIAIYGGLVGNGQFNTDASDFDLVQGTGTAGVSYTRGDNAIFASYSHGELLVGGDRYRSSDGVSVEWRRAISELATGSIVPQYARLSYTGANEIRDSDFYAVAFSARRIWLTNWQPVANIAFVAGREENREDVDYFSRNVLGASLDVTVSPRPAWAINAAFNWQRSDYRAPIPLLGVERRDDNHSGSLAALYFITRDLTARVEVQYFQNHSNIELYRYDRTVVAAKLRYDFR